MTQRARERVQIKPSTPRGLQAAIVLAMLFSVTPTVRAQQALATAIRGDDAYAARSAADFMPPDDALRAGPILFQAGLSYSLEWNDNVFLTPTDPEDDLIQRPQLNLTATWPVTENSQLSLGVGIGYQAYLNHSELNGLTIAPLSALAWDIKVGDFVFTLYDSISYSQGVSDLGTVSSGTAEIPRLENTGGIRMRWYPSQYLFELGYGHYNYISLSDSSTSYDYLDRSSELFFGRAGYRLAEESTTGLEISSSLTDYRSPQQSDNVNVSFGPYIDWQVTHALNVNLHGGWVFASYDPSLTRPDSETSSSYYLGLRAQHKLTDHITHELSITQGLQQALNLGSDYIESLQAGYSIGWAFHRSASLSLNASYQHDNEPQQGVSNTYDSYGAGVGLSVTPFEHLAVGLSYNYTTRTADQSINDYDQNQVLLTLTYQF